MGVLPLGLLLNGLVDRLRVDSDLGFQVVRNDSTECHAAKQDERHGNDGRFHIWTPGEVMPAQLGMASANQD